MERIFLVNSEFLTLPTRRGTTCESAGSFAFSAVKGYIIKLRVGNSPQCNWISSYRTTSGNWFEYDYLLDESIYYLSSHEIESLKEEKQWTELDAIHDLSIDFDLI